jgi:hypothetical protein
LNAKIRSDENYNFVRFHAEIFNIRTVFFCLKFQFFAFWWDASGCLPLLEESFDSWSLGDAWVTTHILTAQSIQSCHPCEARGVWVE